MVGVADAEEPNTTSVGAPGPDFQELFGCRDRSGAASCGGLRALGAFTLIGENWVFDPRVGCRPVQEPSPSPGCHFVFAVASSRSRVTCTPSCSTQLASKCSCLLMIIDAACLLDVLSGWPSVCSPVTRVTARCPPLTFAVMNSPQKHPSDRKNVVRKSCPAFPKEANYISKLP